MSVVIAVKDRDRFILGADKQSTLADSKSHTATKIWEVPGAPGLVMGTVGYSRFSQILRFTDNLFDKNIINTDDPAFELDVKTVMTGIVPEIMELAKLTGFLQDIKDRDVSSPVMSNYFIIAYKDKAFKIDSAGCVEEIEDFDAIGSGEQIAKGYLSGYFTKENDTNNGFEAIVGAIEFTSYETIFVDNGIDFITTDYREKDEIYEAAAVQGITFKEAEAQFKKSDDDIKKQLSKEQLKMYKADVEKLEKTVAKYDEADKKATEKRIAELEKQLAEERAKLNPNPETKEKKSIFKKKVDKKKTKEDSTK